MCQQTCTTLLASDPENEEGTVLMADIAFRKVRIFAFVCTGFNISNNNDFFLIK